MCRGDAARPRAPDLKKEQPRRRGGRGTSGPAALPEKRVHGERESAGSLLVVALHKASRREPQRCRARCWLSGDGKAEERKRQGQDRAEGASVSGWSAL